MQHRKAKSTIINDSIQFAGANKVFTGWLGATALAGCLALSGNPYAAAAGAAIAGAATSGAAVTESAKKRVAAAEKAGAVNRSKFEAELSRLDEDKAAIAKSQRDIDTKNAQLIALEGSLATQQRTMKDRMMVEAQREAQAKVEAMQQRLDTALQDKAAMQATYQERSTEMAKKTGLIVSKVQRSHKDLGDVAAQTISTGNEILAKERHQVNQVLENLSRDIKVMASELAAQKELVAKLQAPKHLKMRTHEANVMNDVQTFLAIERGVTLSCDSIGKIHYGLTPMFFEPIGCDLKQVQEQLEALQLHLGLDEKPTAEIDSGKIKLTVQLSQDKTAKPAKEITIVNPPLSRLEAELNESIHARIVAQSGSGKTVLLGNLINYLTQVVSSDYVLSDPKVTAPENWGNLTPTYYSRECLDHFFGLTETCLNRIDEAAASVKAGHGMPKFEYEFHVIDELEFLYGLSEVSANKDHNSKLFKINAKSMLKVGREHKMKLLFVTQSPLPSDLNLRKNDFENCSSIFLGSQISAGLNSTDADGLLKDVPPEKIAQLKAEYRARMARGDEYVYLFFNPAKPADLFMGLCPSPGHYAALRGEQSPKRGVSQSGVFEGVDPVTRSEGEQGAVQSGQRVQPSTVEGDQVTTAPASTAASTSLAPLSTDIEALLNQGTHCPKCSHHSASYSKRSPNGKGNVSVKCSNPECSRKTFSWKVI